jgi:hypothetical protein
LSRRQCRINHMAETAYNAGPALTLFYFLRIFCSLFQRGAQTVCQCGAPKSPSPQKTRGPKLNLKSEAPKSGAPNGFFCSLFQCFSAGAQGPQKTLGPKFKNRGPKWRGPKRLFCSLFQRGIQTMRGPKESKAPKNGALK